MDQRNDYIQFERDNQSAMKNSVVSGYGILYSLSKWPWVLRSIPA